MELVKRNGEEIQRWQDWERPKSEIHWKKGRSAMEVAKSWFRQSDAAPPSEIVQMLFNHFLQDVDFMRSFRNWSPRYPKVEECGTMMLPAPA